MNKISYPSVNSKLDIDTFKDNLMEKLHDQFNFRMQLKLGKLKQTHLLRLVRRDIASIKFSLSDHKSRSILNK